MVISSVPLSLDGSDVADEYLQQVYAGAISDREARLWVAELHREGFPQLAAAVSYRLPVARSKAA